MAEITDLTARTELGESFRERSVEEIRQDIAARREAITETVDKLGEQVQRKLDWREYVADHPFAALGIAAGTGMLVAGIFKRRATPAERIMSALSDSVEDLTGRLRDQLDLLPAKRPGAKSALMVAATSFIAKAVTDSLGNHFRDRETSHHPTNSPEDLPLRREQARSTSI